jgi:GNAT superfamily N-acetyltransferase
MVSILRITPITAFHPGVDPLRADAKTEGFRFIDRFVDDWTSNSNRFDQLGEQFLGAFEEGALVGVCGLNRDPYVEDDSVGRLRHLYVRTAARRHGVGTALVHRLLDEGGCRFRLIRLRTENAQAAVFYIRFGFRPVENETASHVKSLQ